jgi:small-conductance mechanosensitive channel
MSPSSTTIETLEQVGQQFLNTGDMLGKIVASLIIIVVLLLARKALNKLIVKSDLARSNAYFWHKLVGYSVTVLMALAVGGIWLYGVSNLATFFGLLVAGLIVALQEPVVNLAGWLFILARHPIALGDRIEIDGIRGDVIDIGPLFFSIMEIGQWVDADQSTGRIIHIPNKLVFSNPIANYTQQFPYIWDEMPVIITFESNWEKAKGILEQLIDEMAPTFTEREERYLRELATRYYIRLDKLTPIVYTSVSDSGVMLTIRYLTQVQRRRNMEREIWEAVLHAFAREDDIDFAYNTQRVFYNPREGKPGAGGPKPRGER